MANFIPHQSCVYREFLNGNANDPIGITITGERSIPGAIGSTHFVMRVRYDGMMLWKMDYPLVTQSGVIPSDQGWDIMFEAESVGVAGTVDNFVITGLSNAIGTGATPGCLGFLSRVNVNTGAFVNAHRFGVPATTIVPIPLMYGQGIYQSSGPKKNVVITGGIDHPSGGIFSDTYLLEMDITNGTLSNAHHYNLTTPNFPRTESVVSVGTGYPTPGYFISTNAVNTYGGGTLTDGHVIKTDVLGRVNSATCHSDTLKPVFDTVKSNPVQHCTEQVCDNFIQHQMVMKKKTANHVLCFSATKLTDDLEAALELGEKEIGVYPNPVSGNSDIQLLFTADHSGEYDIRILDVNGRAVHIVNQHFEEGDHQFSMATSMLAEGMYVITVYDGIRTASAKFIKVK